MMDCRVLSRVVTLFAIGAVLSMALDLLLVDRDSQPWWLVPVSGMGAVCVGMLYPVFVSESAADAPDGAKVIRCVAVFVGIYQASNKIYFSSYVELSVTLVALAIGMWWLFDRSRAGLTFSIFLTLISFTITHSLLRYRLISEDLMKSEYLYNRAWCIYFSACITFGTVGRWVYWFDYG